MAGKRPSAKAIGLLLAVFVLGGVAGSLGTYVGTHDRQIRSRQTFLDQFRQQVQLTPSQLVQIRGILAEGHKRWEAIREKSEKEAQPQFDALHAEIRKRIRAVLTPAQQPKFDEFLKRLEAEHKAREKQHHEPR
jgi:Spy/CpxP family protein refolding chaperone